MRQPKSAGHSLLLLASLAAAACGGPIQSGLVSTDLLNAGSSDLATQNGMSTNGMSTNGMSTNGMSTNGIQGNGLTLAASGNTLRTKGLTNTTMTSVAFDSWFQKNTSYANMVMAYLVRCAVPAGQTRRYTGGGVTYAWSGVLGLAPLWSAGAAINTVEQQVISACLGAHANRFSMHVNFSILGYGADGTPIPLQFGESSAYPIQEGAFFGNIFTGGAVYTCSDGTTGTNGVSGPRECAMSDMPGDVCSPMVNTQAPCWSMCQGANVPGAGWMYVSCNAPDGHNYPALDTSLQSSDVYWCGDGVCQFTESCYDAATGTGCAQDCGRCN